jgi:threonine/homoserine/homoserine lactone efflux protein
VFFTALLPQFVDASKPMTIQFVALGVISIIVELPVLLAYGFAADRGRAVYGKHARLIERLSGACLSRRARSSRRRGCDGTSGSSTQHDENDGRDREREER